VNATFKHTMITSPTLRATRSPGRRGHMAFLQGLAQAEALCGAGCPQRMPPKKAQEHGMRTLEVEGWRTGLRCRESALRSLQSAASPSNLFRSGRDPDRTNGCPSPQEAPRMTDDTPYAGQATSPAPPKISTGRVGWRNRAAPSTRWVTNVRSRRDWQELIRTEQAQVAIGQRPQTRGDGSRRAAGTRLRPEARQCAQDAFCCSRCRAPPCRRLNTTACCTSLLDPGVREE